MSSEYERLVSKAIRSVDAKLPQAEAALRKAMLMEPNKPQAYGALGALHSRTGDDVASAGAYLKAASLSSEDSPEWARATSCYFQALRSPACKDEPRPPWWNDEALKDISARCVALAPGDGSTHAMRAVVLSGACEGAPPGPRTPAEFKEAAAACQACAGFCEDPKEKRHYITLGVVLHRKAAGMAASADVAASSSETPQAAA